MCGRQRVSSASVQGASDLASGAPTGSNTCLTGDAQLLDHGVRLTSENFAPSFASVIVTASSDDENSSRSCKRSLWGLIPTWTAKTYLSPRDHYAMFNARAESVHEKASFKGLLAKKRCVVVCDGFYEWHGDKKNKQPYYIHPSKEGELMYTAGLFEEVFAAGEKICSYTMLTTDACPRFKVIHSRQPVLLTKEQAELWLRPLEDKAAVMDVLTDIVQKQNDPNHGVMQHSSKMIWHPVTKEVGKVQYQGEDCAKRVSITEAEIKSDGSASVKKPGQFTNIMSFFKKVYPSNAKSTATSSSSNTSGATKRPRSPVLKPTEVAPAPKDEEKKQKRETTVVDLT